VLRALKAPAVGQTTLWDAASPLGIRTSQGGSKTFVLMIGSGKRHTIGRYPAISLSEARIEARRILAEKTLGISRQPTPTFNSALDTFLETSINRLRARTLKDYRYHLVRHFKPHFGDMQLGDLSARQIAQCLDQLSQTPGEQGHAYLYLRGFLGWAVRRHYLDRSPMAGMTAPSKSASRDRVLSDDELRQIWMAASQLGTFGRIVKLLILTGQRRGEIASLRRDWISTDAIAFPSYVTKNGREHSIPLGTLAASFTAANVGGGLVLPARHGAETPFNGWSKAKARLDTLADVHDWTLHDLRRTFATGLAALGVPIHVTEKILNHVSGTTGGIVSVYQKHRFWPEQVAAIEAWEKKLGSICSQAA
jgi:integrase